MDNYIFIDKGLNQYVIIKDLEDRYFILMSVIPDGYIFRIIDDPENRGFDDYHFQLRIESGIEIYDTYDMEDAIYQLHNYLERD